MAWIDGFQFALDDDIKMIQEVARNFAETDVLPLAEKIDKDHYFPKELVAKLSQLGFMGINVPAEYGGSDLSYTAYAIIIEEIAAACASTAVIISAHNSLCISPILKFGTDDQKKEYLPKLTKGEHLGCFALSEPGTGSDAANLTCTVKKDGDDYVISGTKNWITNAPEASTCVLLAMQDSSKGNKGITAFVHSMKHPGVSLGKKEDKLGIRGSPTSSINYDNVRLKKNNLLDKELNGFAVAMDTLNGGRIGVAAQAVGIARAAMRDALNYSKDRKTFGKAICEHQSIQNYLADMIIGIDSSRYLTLAAAALKDNKKSYVRQASMAKLHSSEVAMQCAIKGIQIHGGYGYVTDYPAERHLRDAKITEIYEGTSEIQRLIIAGQLIKD
jgi:butyryl-CoA dehydrogenase